MHNVFTTTDCSFFIQQVTKIDSIFINRTYLILCKNFTDWDKCLPFDNTMRCLLTRKASVVIYANYSFMILENYLFVFISCCDIAESFCFVIFLFKIKSINNKNYLFANCLKNNKIKGTCRSLHTSLALVTNKTSTDTLNYPWTNVVQ